VTGSHPDNTPIFTTLCPFFDPIAFKDMKNIRLTLLAICGFLSTSVLWAQDSLPALPKEDDYYRIIKIPVPEGVILEVGGLCNLPNGHIAASTRRGDVWIIENPTSGKPNYRRFATGLHEILGLVYKDGSLYCAQRGELTKLTDRNGDGIADRYETVYAWPLSGHYHEYTFGPKVLQDGSFLVTGNVSFGASDWWSGKSVVPWRGWTMHITPDGKMDPWAAGFRSPCGIGMVNGEFFYGDNQGDWMGSGFVTHVEKGDFVGHPASLAWADRPESPVNMRKEFVFQQVDPKDDPKKKPEYIAEEPMTTLYEMEYNTYRDKQIKSPSVWLPHGILGVSTSEIIADETSGAFGPFAGQLLVGDQGMSKIARVFLEKVKGEYQGAAFDFRNGFRSGVLRMCWGSDQTMYIGGTNRGWGSTGKEPYGLERLVWTGQTPFEMKAMRAMPDGFEIEFTQPVDVATAENVENYAARSFTYRYYPVYGSPMVNYKENPVLGAKASADGLRVRLVVDSLRLGYVHAIQPEGVRSAQEKLPLLHGTGYYTLKQLPDGPKANFPLAQRKPKMAEPMEDLGTKVNTPDNQMKEARPGTVDTAKPLVKPTAPPPAPQKPKVLTDAEAMTLLTKHTCTACHKKTERSVGPAYTEVAKRKYSTSQIIALVHNPKPENWPDYTPMAPMPQVPKKDLEKIAVWINSLRK
jgi:cytochrome c551/c552